MSIKKRKTNRWLIAVGVLAVAAIIVVPIAAACFARKRSVDEIEIPELEQLMNNAADIEDYTLAAFYRDKIKERKALQRTA